MIVKVHIRPESFEQLSRDLKWYIYFLESKLNESIIGEEDEEEDEEGDEEEDEFEDKNITGNYSLNNLVFAKDFLIENKNKIKKNDKKDKNLINKNNFSFDNFIFNKNNNNLNYIGITKNKNIIKEIKIKIRKKIQKIKRIMKMRILTNIIILKLKKIIIAFIKVRKKI